MAERAALVRGEEGDAWDVYHSQWGGTDRSLSAICTGVRPFELPVSWQHDRSVDSFTEAVAGLDYLGFELLYREGGGQTAFLTLWFGLPLKATDCHFEAGAAVEVRSLQDARRVRTAFREFKGRLADGLEAGAIPASVAPAALVGKVYRLQGRERYAVWRDTGPCDVPFERPGES